MHRSTSSAIGAIAVAALASSVCDALHECGHAAATWLPVGVKTLAISSIGTTTSDSNAVVAAAGPVVNLVGSLVLASVWMPGFPSRRYACWLFGTFNLFNAAAYLLYSAALNAGDMAVVFNSIVRSPGWRPWVGVLGMAAYAAAIGLSLKAARELVRAQIIDRRTLGRYCWLSYVTGGVVLTLASVLNPVSPVLIATSGAATGFGAMAGLAVLPALLGASSRNQESVPAPRLCFWWGWLFAGAVVTACFVGIMGPGIRLGS